MARPPRICRPGLSYHVMSRCIEKKNALRPRSVKDLMMRVVSLALDKYRFELVSYAIMDNHVHFTIRTLEEGPSISRIMQFIKSQFAQRYNRAYNRTGPFWNERFTDSIIDHASNPERYLLWLIWYLAYNPVRKGYAGDPRQYSYSSIRAYIDQNYVSPVPITLHSYFMNLGQTFHERVKRFLLYEEAYRKRLALMF